MGIRKAQILFCDNPECDVETEYEKGKPIEKGVIIEKGEYHLDGVEGAFHGLYAHSLECVVPAIQASILIEK